jgi:hypothetical protein
MLMRNKDKKPKVTLAQNLEAERDLRQLKRLRRRREINREVYQELDSEDPHVVQLARRRILRQLAGAVTLEKNPVVKVELRRGLDILKEINRLQAVARALSSDDPKRIRWAQRQCARWISEWRSKAHNAMPVRRRRKATGRASK